ncbi:hypothetical protein [Phaeovulum vinaykumarii]|uniref:Uncharacterized protein n=1 Tax=Phaeovulum vinaykumarii TaxID=407234 RepID=A0A1N7KEB9_9RHOB|nr:hypothetical protein [Phaeovulum vinaykumarii]SIS59840.1 hypothetical protein SAMN05421795_101865 [Phaeovulum vinaykumarii]SOB94249.1 hypothetical protein SAMN05878426_101861 [Phaeovulum vinaykumarii]
MDALDLAILAATVMTGALLAWPRLARARLWRATITPLASIIGSGFLVLGPVLDASFGMLAPAVMAGLCLLAWGFGASIRANIAARATDAPARRAGQLDTLASAALAFAYVISVAYYLNLLGAFGVRLTPFDSPGNARLLTSAVFVLILVVGWTRGFGALERLEQVSVGLKLAIIAGFLLGLSVHFAQVVDAGAVQLDAPTVTPGGGLLLAFGLIVTVQGFETARYLGAEYDAPTRIRAMKLAQIVSAAIYMVYIALVTFAFAPGDIALSETAIIEMMQRVAPILSLMLVAAALAAQFSAAVADTGGCGGLVAELSRGRVSVRGAYAVLVAAGLALTWSANIFEIIAYASRAFAAYYAIQSAIAALGARGGARGLHAGLAALGVAITLFGMPVE